MKAKKLVILDKNEFNKEQRKEFAKFAEDFQVFDDMPKDDDTVIQRIGNADAVIVCWYEINQKILDSCKNLKYLGIVATGYEWLDYKFALKKNIILTNVPNYATESVSDFVFKQLENSKIDLNDKTIGIIGLGNIGKRIYSMCKDGKMNVLCWNRTPNENYSTSSLDNLFKFSDIIITSLKLNSETEGIIKNKYLDLMKRDSVIVNFVSPKLFEDKNYLMDLVSTKNIKLILDFISDGFFSELNEENVFYTPCVAWKSEESIFNLHQIASENFKSYCNGKIQNKVK